MWQIVYLFTKILFKLFTEEYLNQKNREIIINIITYTGIMCYYKLYSLVIT